MAKTIKVRIALVVDETGGYGAAGLCGRDDKVAVGIANSHAFRDLCCVIGADGARARHIITADVPVPECTEIAGQVEDD